MLTTMFKKKIPLPILTVDRRLQEEKQENIVLRHKVDIGTVVGTGLEIYIYII